MSLMLIARTSDASNDVPRARLHCSLCMSLAALTVLAGCGKSATSLLRTGSPVEAAASVMKLYDANTDGKLTAEELKASPSLNENIVRIDTNRDGAVDVREMQTRFEAHDKMPNLMGFDLQITTKRRPLVGALVTFIPEAFMGEDKQSYVGTTANGGVCSLDGQEVEVPGVPTGYYTVHIVHGASKIDVKRGVEVANDTPSPNRLQIDTEPMAPRRG